jgi:glyoxylase-like metal-dependent hydrolase (beta-lactamase superfamily II)
MMWCVPFAVLALATSSSAVKHIYDFAIPHSNHTVDVKMIHAFNGTNPSSFYFKSDQDLPANSSVVIDSYAFLIEHPRSGRRVLFDLGLRKDFENLSPGALKAFGNPDGTLPLTVDKDVPTQLIEGGVPLESIDTIIWRYGPCTMSSFECSLLPISHSHFDHIGAIDKIPSTTQVVVGPGTLANSLPGYPVDPDSIHLASDFTSVA